MLTDGFSLARAGFWASFAILAKSIVSLPTGLLVDPTKGACLMNESDQKHKALSSEVQAGVFFTVEGAQASALCFVLIPDGLADFSYSQVHATCCKAKFRLAVSRPEQKSEGDF